MSDGFGNLTGTPTENMRGAALKMDEVRVLVVDVDFDDTHLQHD